VSNEARIFKHKIVPDERYERKGKDYNGANGSWLQGVILEVPEKANT